MHHVSSSPEAYVSEVETALLRHPAVADCAVLAGVPSGACDGIGAYVVPRGGASAVELAAHARELVPDAGSVSLVLVTSIPLTPEGGVDEARLREVPILEGEAAEALRVTLATATGAAVTVGVRERPRPREALHVGDLLPARAPVPDRASPSSVAAVAGSVSERLAITEGDSFTGEFDPADTLAATLLRTAERFPRHGLRFLTAEGENALTYPELLLAARGVLSGLRRAGLQPQDKVLFQFERNRDFVIAFWACVLGGFVPVPLAVAPSYREANAALTKVKHAWEMFRGPLLLTSATLRPGIESAVRLLALDGAQVADIDSLAGDPDAEVCTAQAEEPALIMLTSGSTGAPKAVVLSHQNLVWRACASRQVNQFDERDVSLNWMALDHVAGIIYFHLRDVYLGANQIHAATDLVLQDPLHWLDWIDRYRVTVTFAPNFAFGLVNDCAAEIARRTWDLSSLRYVLNGAEAIVARTARRFLTLLQPHGLRMDAMRPAWGMSETSSGVIYSDAFTMESTTDEDPFVEVGRPIPGVAIRIVDDAVRPVAEGVIGRLQIRGRTVLRGYYERPDLNAEAFTADGWFDTGDLGLIRNGRLTVTGREKDDIVIAGAKYYCHEIEGIVNELPDVITSFTAACAVRTTGADTESLAVFFVPSDSADLIATIRTIRRNIARAAGVSPEYVVPVAMSDIPKTSLGKIQRADLRRRFESGGFAAELRQVDILMGGANTIPDWLFTPAWRRRRLRPSELARLPAAVLLFDDRSSLAVALKERLCARGVDVIMLEAGERFESCGDGRYRVRPALAADLVAPLAAASRAASLGIVYLAHTTPDAPAAAAAQRAHDLTALAQALSGAGQDLPATRILAVTTRAQEIEAGEVADPVAPVSAALLKTIAQELEGVSAAQVDVDDDASASADQLIAELESRALEEDVAYRSGARHVVRLRRPSPRSGDTPPAFIRGGLYVVTGGLGGVGMEVARLLLAEYDAHVLILGRRDVTGTDGGPGEALRQLAAGGGTVRYEACDVTDGDRLRRVIATAEQNAQRPVDGVLHLAGGFHEKLLSEETRESIDAALDAKVRGAQALHDILADRRDALFIAFSSVTGFFGGFAVGAYAAANAFLDGFARWRRSAGWPHSYSIAWSQWQDIGMSRSYAMKDHARARGHEPITGAQGINAVRAVLARPDAVCMVGLADGAAAIRRHFEVPCEPLLETVMTIAATPSEPLPRFEGVQLQDRFGRPLPFTVQFVSPDAEVSGSTVPSGGGAPAVAPRNDLERRISRVWQDVLRLDDIDVFSNFFDVGGTSLLMAQVYRRLRDEVTAELSMTDLFASPTISSLAAHLDGDRPLSVGADQERGEERRRRLQRMQRSAESRRRVP